METPQRFARLLQAIRWPRRPRPSRSSRFAPIALERLEERCVTALFAGADPISVLPAWVDDTPPLIQATPTELLDSIPLDDAAPSDSSPSSWQVPPDDIWASIAPPGVPASEFGERDSLSTEASHDEIRHEPTIGSIPGGLNKAAESQPIEQAEPSSAPPAPSAPPASIALPTPTVAPTLTVTQAASNSFRITVSPAPDTRTEVCYSLTAYSKGGAVTRERLAVISPGAGHVDVPIDTMTAGTPNGPEVVTLSLQSHLTYRIDRASATVFLGGDARRCSEAALLEAYKEGKSDEAFHALVERNRPTVLRTCYRVLGNWHDAEDVSQMVFLALAQGQVRMHSTLAGWLRLVARNAAIVLLRARNRRHRHEQRASRPAMAPAQEPAHDLREELELALARVSAPLREAVRLRYLDGWSQHEAAELVGCPRGTLAQRAAHGLRRLRDILSRED